MKLKQLKPRKALNKAYLKLKPNRDKIDVFKTNLTQLLDRIDNSESEEYHKNLISDFLKRTYYQGNHYINTKNRADLVIHNGKNRASPVGVIIETKRPSNKWEMITPEVINAKAFHELLLYFLRERITNNNLEIRHLIITNIHEWYIFDANVFERNFAQNKHLVKEFKEFEKGTLSGIKTDFFYSKIAYPFIESLSNNIEYTYFDIRNYEKPLRNDNPKDDNKLIALYKLLSAEHLLKLPFANDSNTLDKRFYGEMLHIMGLSESKQRGKQLIGREKEGSRNIGSFIENAINELDSLDKINRLDKPSQYGETMQERLFNVALELSITWMNRILFMKLLEAQLIKYHKGDTQYQFLNIDKIKNYDDLNSLFFKVLARKLSDRGETTKEAFKRVPYLNSSLFEPTELEHTALFVSNLSANRQLPIYSATVLKDAKGKRRTGKMNSLEYLFEFLDAYDFTSEGSEAIQEDNKTLINASVLGLIFEKINGYKDGSFFTPGFITMYMCRETIRKAVIQKFNEVKGWGCKDMTQLYNRIDDITEANQIVNSLKICDPAVGSGHFLVSALNEIIAIKNDLRILKDREGFRLKEYHVVVENDELIVTDEEGIIFEYNPTSRESQRVQEALFHEKQTIIENCLFGVDINPNSVKICRLRLWIELLKNAYYKNEMELETLPNIDINIKCGNSLVSRFDLDANLGQALKKSKWTIDSYRAAVSTYRNAKSREEKRQMEQLMKSIKSDFRSEIASNDPKVKRLNRLSGELYALTQQQSLFEMSKREKTAWNKKVKTLTQQTSKLEAEIEEIKANKIYENAFEWRFEFPEVLNEQGDFVGFDVVIGNPPYIRQEEIKDIKPYLKNKFKTFNSTADLYVYFVERGMNVLKDKGSFIYILPNKWFKAGYGIDLRAWIKQYTIDLIVDFGDLPVFDEATTYPCVLSVRKTYEQDNIILFADVETLNFPEGLESYLKPKTFNVKQELLEKSGWALVNIESQKLVEKIRFVGESLSDIDLNIFYGIKTGANKAFVIDEAIKEQLIKEDPKSIEILKPFLAGRDIKRYESPVSNKYLIISNRGIDIESYPAVLNHLSKFKEQLSRRAGSAAWYELQASPGETGKFEETKIMYPDISKNMNFILDESGHYSLNTVYNISSSSKGLLAYLNSKLFHFYYQIVSNSIRGGYMRFFTSYMSTSPIPTNTDVLEPIADKIIEIKKQSPTADTTFLESQINQLVYELYGLTEEEIEIVEGA